MNRSEEKAPEMTNVLPEEENKMIIKLRGNDKKEISVRVKPVGYFKGKNQKVVILTIIYFCFCMYHTEYVVVCCY